MNCQTPDNPMTRRDMLRNSMLGFGSVALSAMLADRSKADRSASNAPLSVQPPHFKPTAKRAIFIYNSGTTIGILTDEEGKFELELPDSVSILLITYPEYKSQQFHLGDATDIVVRLLRMEAKMDDVVITALGIPREERALGYGYTKVDPKSATENRDANFMNTLSGKVAGLQVTKTNGGPGSSSRVLLRGISSLGGQNQPLFVVDGVPVDNTTRGSGGTWGGVDFGSPISNINPDDIASITVLKGPNAAALYGSRAGNGVVIITTKSGSARKGIGVSFNSNLTIDQPYILRKFQNVYGAGNNGKFESDADSIPFFNTALEADSWGPRMEGQVYRDWDDSLRTYSPQPNNWRDFFQTGITSTNSLSFDGGTEDRGFRLSYTDLRNKGTAPNSTYSRNNLVFRATAKMVDRIHLDVKANYIHQEAVNRINQSDGRGAGRNFNFMPRNISLSSLENYATAGGNEKIWYSPWAWQSNPYWRSFEDRNSDSRDRLIGLARASIDLTDWMSFSLRSGMDFYRDFRTARTATGSFANPAGDYSESFIFFKEQNTDFLLQANRKLGDKWQLGGNVGGNLMRASYADEFSKAERLAIPHFYHVNFGEEPALFFANKSREEIYSLYGAANVAYNNFLYLDVTARNDWSSTLPITNNSYFYPSANLSFVWSEAFDLGIDAINFGKIRASAAAVGNDTDPHQLDIFYQGNGSYLGNPRNTIDPQRPPSDLRPSRSNSYELGLDLRMFSNRFLVDLTVYRAQTIDHILAADIAASSGFSTALINAGETRSTGFELMLKAEWLRKSKFSWMTSVALSRNRSQVISLTEDLENLQLASQWGVTVEARPGNLYGDIVGIAIAKDENGNRLVNDQGMYIKDGFEVLGNVQPDLLMGVTNAVQIGNLNISFLVDFKIGGDIYAASNMYAMGYSGNFVETLEGREEWYASEAAREEQGVASSDWTATGGFLAEGVYAPETVIDGQDVGGQTNTTYVNPELYWAQFSNWGDELHEPHVYDASFVKLREIAVSYPLPTAWAEKLHAQGIGVSLVGRNLWIIHKNLPNLDPESFYSNGNGQGIEYGSYPGPRSIGINLNVKW